ncbi:unnamed protein product [Linum tenue]|uniref:Uncharacterized protein n=1 Tax=Linum tenue TaxID=586396 RepID=A0AAV0HEJ8_9ROSI|nr:unnamed protein product [Linum tenue]
MRKMRGFKLGKRFFRVANWIFGNRRRNRSPYGRLISEDGRSKPINKLVHWGRRLTTGAKSLCLAKFGYLRVEHEALCGKAAAVPKGHLAFFVGGGGEGRQRLSQSVGASDLREPPSVRQSAEGHEGIVRVRPGRRDHDSLPFAEFEQPGPGLMPFSALAGGSPSCTG